MKAKHEGGDGSELRVSIEVEEVSGDQVAAILERMMASGRVVASSGAVSLLEELRRGRLGASGEAPPFVPNR